MAHVLAKKWGGHGRPCRPYAAAYDVCTQAAHSDSDREEFVHKWFMLYTSQ